MTWIMWLSITFSYYSFFVWIPGLLVESGMSMTKSFGYSLAIYCAQVPGYFSAAWFNEKIGRQATIASYMLLGGAGALGLALAKTDGQIMLAGIIMSFFMNGTYAGVYAYTAEVFPTAVRTRRGWPRPSAGWAPSPRPCWWAICIPSLVSWACSAPPR